MPENNMIQPPDENAFEGMSWFKKINAYIASNMQNDLTIDAIMQQFRLSRTTLERVFIKHTGQSYKQYVETVRIEKAKELIVMEGYMVKEAMYATGYKNRGTFRYAFKKKYGKLPIHFRIR